MDPRFHGVRFGNQSSSSVVELSNGLMSNGARFEITHPDQRLVNGGGVLLPLNRPFSDGNIASTSYVDDYQDDCDFSDAVLTYIDQILMEEDMEEKTHMLQESLDLQAKEKSFYEVLGQKYPPSPLQPESASESPDDYLFLKPYNSTTSSSDGSGYLYDIIDPNWVNSRVDYDTPSVQDSSTYQVSTSFYTSSTGLSNVVDGFSESPVSPLQIRDESQSVWNFQKGVEEANKFLPSGKNLSVNVDITRLLAQDLERRSHEEGSFKAEEKVETERSPSEAKGKKNLHLLEDELDEERCSKLAAIYRDNNKPAEEFDDCLLFTLGEAQVKFVAFRTGLKKEASRVTQQDGQLKTFNAGKGRVKKQQTKKKEVIDLRTLLISCAQAVAADDRRNATELLKQIRRHSSPFGDGNQRLSHYFADGLEARLAGNGSQIHKALVNKRTTASDYIRAYYTYLASSPFRKISNFSSNKTIMIKAQKATRVHVIDFGILYGFQWPTFIQRIADREGGPPKLRITGIDFPQPGFRPAERIEDTGRRLARYAEKFNVPFEYSAIAQSWDSIKLEDLKIEEDEFVVVTCLYRTKNLLDETVVAESTRTKVLNFIRKINPAIFIHGIVNGAYSAPFFVTRFREVLFHFSALFDMLEHNVPREKPERLLIERDIFGREALNVIACEGWERVERPETYKQWQVRDLKAGFMQIPFEREVMNRSKEKVKTMYHKDFVIDEDSQWLLMGWKGRIIYAISCWKPV